MSLEAASVKKVVRDGKVAVLVSPGHGAGWSTWNHENRECLFSPDIVALVEAKAGIEIIWQKAHELWGDEFYARCSLVIEWIPQGTAFEISDYDGDEAVRVYDETDWEIA